jgi:hypothetical protein
MDIQTGASLAGYTILRELGAGGMGAVYLVKHPRLPRQDAMKVIDAQLSSDPVYAARFGREAELACGLDHPSLVRVYDRGFDEGRLWLTMHYVQGLDLDQLLRRDGPVDPIRAVWMVSALADALDYAHDAGLVHRVVPDRPGAGGWGTARARRSRRTAPRLQSRATSRRASTWSTWSGSTRPRSTPGSPASPPSRTRIRRMSRGWARGRAGGTGRARPATTRPGSHGASPRRIAS